MKLPWAMLVTATSVTSTITDPVDFVNILGGTNSRYDLSHGNTLPLMGTPWGFNTWSPMTTTGSSWYFHPYDVSFYGIRCTHQPR
jgi:putative alpha-1,2-mannosidase